MHPDNVAALRPLLARLEAATPALRHEALAASDALWTPMPSSEMYHGAWEIFPLILRRWREEFPGIDLDVCRGQAPQATTLFDDLPNAEVAGFLRLHEGSFLDVHQDHRDDHVVRVHLALVMPGAWAAAWPEGTARLLDVRQPHSARNPGPGPRITAVVDVHLPQPVGDGDVALWADLPA